ncbi:MAG: hypothetical protein NMNS01_25760 [Nitrosomonas sp.]|nr:MAG: hypothetical protein NMNS01_25760 [Nitrosomonas sp.]
MRNLLFLSLLIVFSTPHVKADSCSNYVAQAMNDFRDGVVTYGSSHVFKNHRRPDVCRDAYAFGWNEAVDLYRSGNMPAPSYGGYRNPDPMNRGLNAVIRANQARQREIQMLDTLQSIDHELTRQRYGY